MTKKIDPKIEVMGFGPVMDGLTPDEICFGAGRITYKGEGALEEIKKLKEKGDLTQETIQESLIKSVGAGHASMATTEGLWFYVQDSSKMIDSVATRFSSESALMPSGRRVPITLDSIVVPAEIEDSKFKEEYLDVSKKNIKFYEYLIEQGVSKQDASKTVQYGHAGGGFFFMPVETIIQLKKDSKDTKFVPSEIRQVVDKLEDFISSNGMGITYYSRLNAPRLGCPNTNPFHNRKNLAQELIEDDFRGVVSSGNPQVVNISEFASYERDKRIENYVEKRNSLIKNGELNKDNYLELMEELGEIVEDYNGSINVSTIVNSPWRVWGEVKRHRKLNQTAESIYNANERNVKKIHDVQLYGQGLCAEEVISIPEKVKQNPELLREWINRFSESYNLNEKMVQGGISPGDALSIVPRGVKMGILKNYDLYNLTTGYLSLRTCNTAEPEMRETTESERDLISEDLYSEKIIELMVPKCNHVGFCPDRNFCNNVLNVNSSYNQDTHKYFKNIVAENIRENLK